LTPDQRRCASEARARDEPLFATASLVEAWLLIEQPGAWGPDALTDSKLPTEVAVELQRRSAGVRILLIRRRSRSTIDRVYFKAHSGGVGRAPIMVSSPLPDPEVLLDIDFPALEAGEVGPGAEVEHPIYLVCTHGRHDICCADRGRPLFRALSSARSGRTWEVSHLGGDRFAGNLLVLPRGDYFGRLEPEDAESLVTGYEAGQLDLRHHRGRSTLPRLVQAAEYFARRSEGLNGLDDLVLSDYRRSARHRAEVVFQGPEGAIGVEVEARPRPESALLTCRAEQSGHPIDYEQRSITRQ
jgi:hypothetical protein